MPASGRAISSRSASNEIDERSGSIRSQQSLRCDYAFINNQIILFDDDDGTPICERLSQYGLTDDSLLARHSGDEAGCTFDRVRSTFRYLYSYSGEQGATSAGHPV